MSRPCLAGWEVPTQFAMYLALSLIFFLVLSKLVMVLASFAKNVAQRTP